MSLNYSRLTNVSTHYYYLNMCGVILYCLYGAAFIFGNFRELSGFGALTGCLFCLGFFSFFICQNVFVWSPAYYSCSYPYLAQGNMASIWDDFYTFEYRALCATYGMIVVFFIQLGHIRSQRSQVIYVPNQTT